MKFYNEHVFALVTRKEKKNFLSYDCFYLIFDACTQCDFQFSHH